MFHLSQPAYHTCEALEHEVSGLSFGTEELNERKRILCCILNTGTVVLLIYDTKPHFLIHFLILLIRMIPRLPALLIASISAKQRVGKFLQHQSKPISLHTHVECEKT